MVFENGSVPNVTPHFYTLFKHTPESNSYGKCYAGPDDLTTTEVSRKIEPWEEANEIHSFLFAYSGYSLPAR